jgi:prepilin-type N-terminal cleavage/methylation domain-containing protein
MSHDLPERPKRHAFTLVEMLTVVIIIGILAALLSNAVIGARKRARIAAQKMEIEQLAMAMEAYRTKYGEYPPSEFPSAYPPVTDRDIAARDAINRHLRKAFPRYDIHRVAQGNTDPYTQFRADLAQFNLNAEAMDGAAALVFWLGGLPETLPTSPTELWAPAGFSANPANPFQPGTSRLPRFYEFQPDSTRLVRDNGTLRYYPSGITTAPYVYFRPRRDANTGRVEYGYALPFNNPTYFQPYAVVGANGSNNVCVPYLDWPEGDSPVSHGSLAAAAPTTNRRWRNADTFQILSPGLDGYYGFTNALANPANEQHAPFDPNNWSWYRYSHLGANFSLADRDNIANFSEGTLEDELRMQ